MLTRKKIIGRYLNTKPFKPFVIKVKQPKHETILSQWNRSHAHTFPETPIVVFKSQICERNNENKNLQLYYISYFNGTDKGGAYVQGTMEIVTCTRAEKKVILEVKDTYDLSRLDLDKPYGFYVGSDPEIFIEDKNGDVIPAFDFLPSNKEGDTIYWDGFQAEFSTTPFDCLAWHTDNVQNKLATLLGKAKAYKKDAKLSTQTVMNIPSKLLEEGKEEHVQFGCMPSFNIYDMKGDTADGRSVNYRSAGGHIHFGLGEERCKDKKRVERIVKALDAIIGVACVSLFAKYDNPRRRQCYGLAGEYRLPPHGLEYRTLSNAWLFHPLIMNLVFDVARKALIIGEKGLLKHWKGDEKETVDCINTCDVAKAQEILNRNKDIMLQIFKSCYAATTIVEREFLFNTFINGMDNVIKDTSDFEGNWTMNGEWITHSNGNDKNVYQTVAKLVTGKKAA